MPGSHTRLELRPVRTAAPDFARGSIFFVGTATTIIRFGGFTILTDPNFLHAGDHAHLGYGLSSKRLTNPAIDIEQLPSVDFCVLSHYHGDHFDQVAEDRLRKDLPVITNLHAASELAAKRFTATVPLETWGYATVAKDGADVRVTALPGRHGPAMVNAFLPPVMGSMLEFQPRPGHTVFRLYITGDTLLHEDLERIPERYPDIDLALFHLGGTKIMGILLTMDAEQGIKALRIIGPRTMIPIHYNDYEVFKSPLDDFRQAAEAAGLADRVSYLAHGDTYEFEVAAG